MKFLAFYQFLDPVVEQKVIFLMEIQRIFSHC